jgi:hypothetical protein
MNERAEGTKETTGTKERNERMGWQNGMIGRKGGMARRKE